MPRETVDIIRDFVELLDFQFDITSAVDNGDGTYTLFACKTYQIQPLPNCPLVIDGVKYTVKSVDNNVSITIAGPSIPTVTQFQIPKPYYFHGTVIKTNLELSQIKKQMDKMPLVYLLEVLVDNFNNNSEVPLDRTSDLRLFFLAPSNFSEWKTTDHYTGAILQMRNLAYQFISILNKSRIIDEFDDYELINRVNFGVYVTDKGNTKRIFNEQLSGVELRINLPINRIFDCKESCEC